MWAKVLIFQGSNPFFSVGSLSNFTQMANKAAGITSGSRDRATINQLNNLILVEHIISKVLQINMQQGKPYKEIYLACKVRIEQFEKIAYLSK